MTDIPCEHKDVASQLALPVYRTSERSFDNFYGVSNRRVKALLVEQLNEAGSFVFLCGASGSGKTHLLQAAVDHAHSKLSLSQAYISLPEISRGQVDDSALEDMLDTLADYECVALDDIDIWLASDEANERRLFNLFNACKASQSRLIVSSTKSVAQLALKLPDLLSRLKSGLTLSLSQYDDEEKIEIITSLARDRGMIFNREVSSFIIRRAERSMDTLVQLLDRLDRSSLARKRRLTVPFIKETLNW